MRRSGAGIYIAAVALLLGCEGLTQVQAVPSQNQPLLTCVNDVADDESQTGSEPTTGPTISVVRVNFFGSLQLPLADQAQIASSIENVTFTKPLEDALDEAIERIKNGWQDRGYFKAYVAASAKTLTSSPVNQRVALTVQIDEGQQYRLGSVVFTNSQVFDAEALRLFFQIENGEIFSRAKIAKGLEGLRTAYGNTWIPQLYLGSRNQVR